MQISAINLKRDNYTNKKDVALYNKDMPVVSFRGKKASLITKNANQLLSIAPEHGGLGLGNYSAGGLAVVVKEAEISWATDLGLDIRTILGYHSKSVKGNIMIARLPKKEAEAFIKDKKLPDFLEEKWIHEVPIDYKPKKDEFFAVIDSDSKNFEKIIENAKDGTKTKEKIKGYKFLMLEPTDVKGKVKALQEGFFKEEEINYRVFKQFGTVKNNGVDAKVTRYFYHIPQIAAMRKAYTNGKAYFAGQIIGNWGDLYYSNFVRAVSDSLPQMAQKEGFNPANIWMHDRPMFPMQLEIARRSVSGKNNKFYRGFHFHSTLHNPGYDYQGYMDDIAGFFKIIFNSNDYEKLKSRDDFNILLDIIKKDVRKRTVSENKRLLKVFGEYCKTMFDENKKPNITMISIANRLLNPQFSTVGTVSRNYAKEMKEFNDIARGLRSKLASIVTHDVTNGSLPASVPIHVFGNFGAGENGLSDAGDGYTPYKPILDKKSGEVINYNKSYKSINPKEVAKIESELKQKLREIESTKSEIQKIKEKLKNSKNNSGELNKKLNDLEELIKKHEKEKLSISSKLSVNSFSIKEAKEANKKWFLDLVASCTDTGKPDGKPDNRKLTKLFFKDAQINNDGYNVQGYLSKYDPKDKIFMNWGRPDPQKGFSTFTQGIYEFFKNKNIPEDKKIHAKFLFGCGKGVFDKNSEDKKLISTYMKKIAEIENGKYAGNVLFAEGMIPNKLVGCVDYGFFTSRFEPCGITPFECYAGGSPVASINTGGAPNFVFDLKQHGKNATGFLTDSAFLIEGDELKKLTGIDTEALKKEIQGDAKEWTDGMEAIFQRKIDSARRKALAPQVSDLIQKCMSVSQEEYDMMAKNAAKQQIEWSTNAMYNIINGKPTTANDAYMDIFGIKRGKVKDGKRAFTRNRSTKAMKALTGEFGDTTGMVLETYKDAVKESVEKFAKNINGKAENNSGFFKKLLTDRRTFYAAGAIALFSGIAAYAINRNNKDEIINPGVKIGKSKIYFA